MVDRREHLRGIGPALRCRSTGTTGQEEDGVGGGAFTRGRDHHDIERDHAPGGIPSILGDLEASARGREATRRAWQHRLGPEREGSFSS